MADVLSVKTQFDNALAKGAEEASVSVEELRDKLTSLQTMMRNLSIGLPMQKVANDFKAAIAQIKDNDPARKLEVWQTAYKKIQDIVGADTIRNAWKGLEDATNPQQILSSFRAIGNEYKRLANEAEASSKKQQQMMKEMYDVALAKYKSNFDRASADLDRSMRGADTSMSQASIMEMKEAAAEIDRSMRGADAFDAKGAEATAEAAKDIDTSMRGADTSISEADKAMQSLKSTTTKTNGIFKNFIGSLTRIAKLRLLRGIIRAVTRAFKEGTENIYQYSAAMGAADASHFKSTMDGLASSFLYLKNSIGSVVAPLLSALLPAIQTVINWVALALDLLAQFFAVMNGQSTYTVARKTATEWKGVGSAVGGAAAAAKEYKNTIMSFDEIHALNDPSTGGGGGGGGGAGTPDYTDMFEERDLPKNLITDFANFVKPVIKSVWDFVEDSVNGFIDAFPAVIQFAKGVFTGNIEECVEAFKKFQKILMDNKTAKFLFDTGANIAEFLRTAIDSVAIWFLDTVQNAIEGARPFLEFLGIDVDKLTGKIETQKKKIEEHKFATHQDIEKWRLWAEGIDKATARAMMDIEKWQYESGKSFASARGAANGAADAVKGVITASNNLSNTSIGNVVENGLWGIYNSANRAKWELYDVLDYVVALSKASLSGIQIAIGLNTGGGAGISFAKGGFVNGYAKGGIIPAYANGTINTADVFLANENGSPELVGRIGNRTAVANQDQMVDVLTNGIIRSLSMFQEGQGSNTEVNVYMNDEVVARAADRGNRSLNRRFNVSLA